MLERKGMGIQTILVLTLGLMTASAFLTMTNTGYFGKYMDQAFGKAENKTDFKVDIATDQDISNLTHFVYASASENGCREKKKGPQSSITESHKWWPTVPAWNERKGGYPALADSYLGQKPKCVGASETLLRGPGSWDFQEAGYDMEGRFSRVKFEVTRPVTLVTYHDENDPTKGVWLERHLIAGSSNPYKSMVSTDKECDSQLINDISGQMKGAGLAGIAVTGAFSSGVGVVAGAGLYTGGKVVNWGGSPRHLGTGPNYVGFFEDQVKNDRRFEWSVEERKRVLNSKRQKGIYCSPPLYKDAMKDFAQAVNIFQEDAKLRFAYISRIYNLDTSSQPRAKIRLCPGDEGYIQVNKGGPLQDGEADRKLFGDVHLYPRIVVTDVERQECGQLKNKAPAQITGWKNMKVHDTGATTIPGISNLAAEDLTFDVDVSNNYWQNELKVGAYKMDGTPLDVSPGVKITEGGSDSMSIKINNIRNKNYQGSQVCRIKLKLIKPRSGIVVASQNTVVSLAPVLDKCSRADTADLLVQSSDVDKNKDQYVTLKASVRGSSYAAGNYWVGLSNTGSLFSLDRTPGYGSRLIRRGETGEFTLTDRPAGYWSTLLGGSSTGSSGSSSQQFNSPLLGSAASTRPCSVRVELWRSEPGTDKLVTSKQIGVRKSLKNCTP